MENQTKQRIVGIIVIVAFVAILVPFLFSGSKKNVTEQPTVSIKIPGVSNQTEIIETTANLPSKQNALEAPKSVIVSEPLKPTNVIPTTQQGSTQSSQLAGSSQTAQPAQLAQPVQNVAIPAPQGSATTQSAPQATISANTAPIVVPPPVKPSDTNKAMAEDQVVVKKQVSIKKTMQKKQPPAKTGGKKIVQAKALKKHTSTAKNTLRSKKANTIKNKKPINNKKTFNVKSIKGVVHPNIYYTIHIGSFSNEKSAQALLKSLHTKGYKPISERINTPQGGLTRISVGHDNDKAKLEKVAKTIETQLKITTRVTKE